jgi:hypothetical protein
MQTISCKTNISYNSRSWMDMWEHTSASWNCCIVQLYDSVPYMLMNQKSCSTQGLSASLRCWNKNILLCGVCTIHHILVFVGTFHVWAKSSFIATFKKKSIACCAWLHFRTDIWNLILCALQGYDDEYCAWSEHHCFIAGLTYFR